MTKDATLQQFGLIISYLLPGYVLLWGVALFVPTPQLMQQWFNLEEVTLGTFLYSTLAAVAVGMLVNAARWLVVDPIHRWTGLRRPAWDFSLLGERAIAFEILTENHYKFFLHYANTLVSLAIIFVLRRWTTGFTDVFQPLDIGILLTIALYFAASRDSLRRFHARVGSLLHAEREARQGRRRRTRESPAK